MAFRVVGVDCATDEARIGLAFGVVDADGLLELRRATLGTAGESAPATIAAFVSESPDYVVAFDAPLGWPLELGKALVSHSAGAALAGDADRLFQRETDGFVRRVLGKRPLEVGADRVARTAHAALGLLGEIRAALGAPLTLAWEPGRSSGAIEVYPTATLLSRGISLAGHKGSRKQSRRARSVILDRLQPELRSHVPRELLIENGDLLDAVISAVAAADFVHGLALPPPDRAVAEREGWIWFRGRGQQALW